MPTGVRLNADWLWKQLMAVDVVASTDTLQRKSKCFKHSLKLRKTHVFGASKDFFKNLPFFPHTRIVPQYRRGGLP